MKEVKLSPGQVAVTADIEETLSLCAQKVSIGNVLLEAMPRALYWMGTAVLGNLVVSHCVRHIVRKQRVEQPAGLIIDDLLVAAVDFLRRKYLYGQSVVATAVREHAWMGICQAATEMPGDISSDVARVLRSIAGSQLHRSSLLMVDLYAERTL